jgi:integrase
VSESAHRWINQKEGPRPSSFGEYRKHVARIESSAFGSIPIRTVTYPILQQWWKELAATGNLKTGGRLAGGTLEGIRNVLVQTFDLAMLDGVMPLSINIVAKLKTPRRNDNEPAEPGKRAFTVEECHAVIQAAEHLRWGLAVPLLIVNGMRASEVLGLCWSDFTDDTFKVERARVYVTGEPAQFGPTKNQGAMGRHFTGHAVTRFLALRREQREHDAHTYQQATKYHYRAVQLDPVFVGPEGRMTTRQGLTQTMQDACHQAGVDPAGVGSHTGRHTHYSRMLDAGISQDEINDNVGHSRKGITATYDSRHEKRTRSYAKQAWAFMDPYTSP